VAKRLVAALPRWAIRFIRGIRVYLSGARIGVAAPPRWAIRVIRGSSWLSDVVRPIRGASSAFPESSGLSLRLQHLRFPIVAAAL